MPGNITSCVLEIMLELDTIPTVSIILSIDVGDYLVLG